MSFVEPYSTPPTVRYFQVDVSALSPIEPQPIPVHISGARRRLVFDPVDRNEYKMEPLNGPYALEAINQIDIPYLTSMPGNQYHYEEVKKILDYWLHIADLLEIHAGVDDYRLRMLQEHCANKRPDERCPCQRRPGQCPEPNDHWPNCAVGRRIEDERAHETHLREMAQEAERQLAYAKEYRKRERENQLRLNAQRVSAVWDRELAHVINDEELCRIVRDCTRELAHRLERAHH